jgi:hypothetical protein
MAVTPTVTQKIDVQSLWAKYEDIAMHFNDLLMRLRSQSLAGVAAVSALVGIFSKEGALDIHMEWIVAEAIFGALGAFWIAIWCLDLLYYNRLLKGAVTALRKLEEQTKPAETFDGHIDMSTLIEAEFRQKVFGFNGRFGGVVAFYVIVFLVIAAGVFFSDLMRRAEPRDALGKQIEMKWIVSPK